jgi:hypothetical protein
MVIITLVIGVATASATERYFTYTYEPETMPQGVTEFEQWITLRTQRSDEIGQHNYNRWDLREEFEYGVTDNYSLSLYVNTKAENFRVPTTGETRSSYDFDGISIENRYMVLNPAEHKVGLALYLEPRYSGEEAEIEEKLILGQRHGDWKWAFNVVHATEWNLNAHKTEGELEFDFGLTKPLNHRLSMGLEVRNHNELPEYDRWEHTAFFAGPVFTYTQEKWWATLTILPQLYGKNRGEDPDGHSGLVLDEHERLDMRLIFGISF